jgi:glycerol kinase
MSYVLAIDQGTTGSTALLFREDGQVAARAYREFTQHYPQPGWVEHDPEEIWRVSLEVMTAVLAEARVGARGLAAIGIANQRETTVVWDRASGDPVYPAIVWQSRQSASICDQLKKDGLEPMFREKTGLLIDPYLSGSKIRWILDRDPEFQRRAEGGRLAFGTIDSWLLWKLTGGSTAAGALHRTDPTNASRTLLYNIHERNWDSELCEALNVPGTLLPEVLPSAGVFGETEPFEGLPAGIPIAGMAGDQQAALYGQGCWEAGQAKNTYGTGCFLLMNTGQRRLLSRHGLLTTICCDAVGSIAYALEGSVFIAGAAIQWLRDELQIISSAAESEELARQIDDNQGVYLVPAFAGLGAPYWDARARGALIGLTRGAGRAHLARAALESIAYQSRDLVECMNRDSDIVLDELRVDGGVTQNDFLMQFQSDILNAPVMRAGLVETTAAGAAHLAGLATGVWKSPGDIEATRPAGQRFEPDMTNERREALYAGWLRAVDQVRRQTTEEASRD